MRSYHISEKLDGLEHLKKRYESFYPGERDARTFEDERLDLKELLA